MGQGLNPGNLLYTSYVKQKQRWTKDWTLGPYCIPAKQNTLKHWARTEARDPIVYQLSKTKINMGQGLNPGALLYTS